MSAGTDAAETSPATADAPVDLRAVAASLDEHRSSLDRELAEIDLLVQQARNEAERHEGRRLKSEQRVTGLEEDTRTSPAEVREARAQLLTLTQRATLMHAQLQILESKQKTLARFRDTVGGVADQLRIVLGSPAAAGATAEGAGELPPTVSRAILKAQEDLRRDIARQMHDGPAQSLANIALQAEIVQRLIHRDVAMAQAEVDQLRRMVQHALDATKRFIFDVRPMVLDDLGLVPTLRRTATDRGRQAGLPIEFESVGADRRLPPELESGLFRLIDDALLGYLASGPTRVVIRLDWTDREVLATMRSQRPPQPDHRPERGGGNLDETADLPPALAAMILEQRSDERQARKVAHALPEALWSDIQARASTLGVRVSLRDDGQTLEAVVATAPP